MKLGVLGYTNRASGLGAFLWDVRQNCAPDSWLSVQGAKGQEQWLQRQVNCTKPTPDAIDAYLRKYQPDVLLVIETPFSEELWPLCRRHRVRTAMVVMQEFWHSNLDPDLFICPTQIGYDKVSAVNKVYFDWPIDVRPFPFVQRHEARRFLHVAGYDVKGLRRQTAAVVAGFRAVKKVGISLTIHSQQPWPNEDELTGGDKRITVRVENFTNPAAVYKGFDVLVQPDAWAGYNRLLLEAKAVGMPVLTTDAAPMNELVTDPEALLTPSRVVGYTIAGPYRTARAIVEPAEITAALRRVLRWDIAAKSARAVRCAIAHSWNDDWRADFARLLEGLCNR